jgi:hypothetical protein
VRARFLDTVKGRWPSRDSIGYLAGDWNLYRYVGNNPATSVDPSGLACLKLCDLPKDVYNAVMDCFKDIVNMKTDSFKDCVTDKISEKSLEIFAEWLYCENNPDNPDPCEDPKSKKCKLYCQDCAQYENLSCVAENMENPITCNQKLQIALLKCINLPETC